MNWIIKIYPQIVILIGIIDAIILLILGIVSAFLLMINYKSEAFWNNVVPATWVIIGSSVGAGVILTITRYIAVWALSL